MDKQNSTLYKDKESFKSNNVSKEAKVTLFMYFTYFLWSVLSAYGLGSSNPDEYSYILGFPAWFFYSCILAYPLCCIAVYFLVQHFFNEEISTDTNNKD